MQDVSLENMLVNISQGLELSTELRFAAASMGTSANITSASCQVLAIGRRSSL